MEVTPHPRSLLDSGTKLDEVGRVHWRLTVYPKAGEAGGSIHRVGLLQETSRRPDGTGDGSGTVADRRARGKLRRYCAANGLNRLGTLTYAGDGCRDPARLRQDVARFFRRLRERSQRALPYAWVPEWHPGGHGLHVHFVVGRYIHFTAIRASWGHGFIHTTLLGDLPVGSGVMGEARLAARYLSKYLGKDFGKGDASGLHRYEVAERFQPAKVVVRAPTWDEALARAAEIMGGPPARVWRSDEEPDWAGPPVGWAQWA
jgi:hypothetical protein